MQQAGDRAGTWPWAVWIAVAVVAVGLLALAAAWQGYRLPGMGPEHLNAANGPASAYAAALVEARATGDAPAAHTRAAATLPAGARATPVAGRSDQIEIAVGEDRACITFADNGYGVSTDRC